LLPIRWFNISKVEVGMERHFHQELEALKSNIVRMATLVEEAIADAMRAVAERSPGVAKQVLEREQQINSFEIANDHAVVDLLALQQPVASDLRLILAALKINNDLERIGDHAVNLAESAISYAGRPPLEVRTEIPRMSQLALQMLREAIDGFIHNTPADARGVLEKDDLMDSLNRKTINDLVDVIRTQPKEVEQALELVRVSRNLERVGDLATNIAEEVVFVAEAHIVKHQADKDGSRP
jgi:phosphate transport system protein